MDTFNVGFRTPGDACASIDRLTGCTGPGDDELKAKVELEPFGMLVDTGICTADRDWLANMYGVLEGLVDSCRRVDWCG